MKFSFCTILILLSSCFCLAQSDDKLYEIIAGASTQRLQKDIQKLVGFGTRHTLSDTTSETRGIGAARR